MVELPDVGCVHRGDCLDVLRTWPGGFVDLCYADPPSPRRPQETLFSTRSRRAASPDDGPWQWDENAAECLDAVQRDLDNPAHDAVVGLHIALGDCGIMAFLAYMAVCLVEIRRVLKPTGSVYLRGGPAAGHYLKVLMDAVFGPRNFRNEIICCDERPKRANRRQFATAHEAILWYAYGPRWTFNGGAGKASGGRSTPLLSWAVVPGPGLRPGIPDVRRTAGTTGLELLERVIEVGSNPGDLVLDPFCADGNSRATASRLGRDWIGIDVPHRVGVQRRDA